MGFSFFLLLAILIPSPAQERTLPELERAGFEALKAHDYSGALQLFDALASAAPKSAGAHLGRGGALSGLLNYAAAVAAFEKATSLDPRSAFAYRQLVILNSQIGRKAETRAAYERTRALGEIPEDQRLPLAQALRRAGWTAEARGLLLELPAEVRSQEENLELGLLALSEGEYVVAAEALERATRDPRTSDAEAEYEMGRALEGLGRTTEAITHYRLAHQKDPQHRSARFRLGSLLRRTGDAAEAQRLLDGYEEYRQWDRRVKLLLVMVTSGKLDAAEQRERSLQLGSLLLEGRDIERAEPVIRQALAADPDDRDALLLSARLDLLARRVPDALRTYEALLAKNADTPARLLRETAAAYALADEPKKAEPLFRRALEKDPAFPEAHLGLGLVLQNLGRLPEAEEHLRRALALAPGLASAQKALEDLLLQKAGSPRKP